MKVYLDNNIFIDLEKNNLSILDLEKLINSKIYQIYYSPAHIQETLEISNTNEIRRNEWIDNRLKLISSYTNNNYLNEGVDNIVKEMIVSPFEVKNTITEVYFTQSLMKNMANYISQESKNFVRQSLGNDQKTLNNLNPEQLFIFLDNLFESYGMISFDNFFTNILPTYQENINLGLSNNIAELFDLLDLFGFFKDKYTQKSNYARFWDSNHCFYASFCDLFISSDKRMIKKAEIAYYFFKIKTKIILYENI